MNRRAFLTSSGAAAAALAGGGLAPASAEAAAAAATPKRALMKIGATARCDDASLKAVARYGIKHVVSSPPIADEARL